MKATFTKATFLFATFGCFAQGAQILVNGGFETGNFTGWSVVNAAGSFPGSNFFVSSTTTLPQSGDSTVGPASGSFYAVSDQSGSGVHALIQSFTIPAPASSVILTFRMFVNSYGGNFVNPIGLDFTDGANQHARVDILSAGASAFTTGVGVLRNLYLGTDAGTNPHSYTSYSFDLTSLLGASGSYQLRFAEVDNQLFLNQGVDNVALDVTPLSGVPEPSCSVGVAFGLVGLGVLRVRRPRSPAVR